MKMKNSDSRYRERRKMKSKISSEATMMKQFKRLKTMTKTRVKAPKTTDFKV